jgi:glycosyltransferase involved in cell wall biosynthesis
MRIAWFVYGALEQPTGGYIYDRLIVEGLRALGQTVTVISIEPGHAAHAPACDAIVGDGLCIPELGPLFETAPETTARVLLVHHLASWEGAATSRAEARAFAACDHVITTSRLTADRLAREYSSASIDVVSPGADRLPAIGRSPRGAQRIELLMVGSLIERKRIGLVLDALEAVADPRIALRIAGDPMRDPAHARALIARIRASRALSESVTALGVISDQALAEELAHADALVLASSLEGYGMVLAEARRAGTALIVARAGAVPEAIGSAEEALLFDDAEDLARLLRRVLDEPRLVPTPRPIHATWNDAAEAFFQALSRAVRARTRAHDG